MSPDCRVSVFIEEADVPVACVLLAPTLKSVSDSLDAPEDGGADGGEDVVFFGEGALLLTDFDENIDNYNSTPRKSLKWFTPFEAFNKNLIRVALQT